MDILRAYLEKFDQLPHEANLSEFWRSIVGTLEKSVDPTFTQQVLHAIHDAFVFTDYEPQQIKDTITGEVVRAKMIAILSDMSKPIHTTVSVDVPLVLKEMSTRIALMGRTDEKIKSAGYLKDRPIPERDAIKVYPCFLSGVNKIRTRGGFHSPNSVTLLGGPKSYKTTFLVSFAMQFAGAGLNVYYADAENGHISIEDRCRQHATGLKQDELYNPEYAPYIEKQMSVWWQAGGSVRVDNYLKGRCTMTDVKYRLEELRAVDGFIPQVVIFDYLDEFIPSDQYDRRKDRRLQIQSVSNEADALMVEMDFFYFTVSPQNRDGGVGEDYKKMYNCWSSFELAQNEYETENNIVEMVSIGQREGLKNGRVPVIVDPERQSIKQIPHDEWLYHIEAMKARGMQFESKKKKH